MIYFLIVPEVKTSSRQVIIEVGRGPKQVELEDQGISISFPAGTFQEPESFKITVAVLLDRPSMSIGDDESVACCGIRFDPPDLTFRQPVKITVPHSINYIDSKEVKPEIASIRHTGRSILRFLNVVLLLPRHCYK